MKRLATVAMMVLAVAFLGARQANAQYQQYPPNAQQYPPPPPNGQQYPPAPNAQYPSNTQSGPNPQGAPNAPNGQGQSDADAPGVARASFIHGDVTMQRGDSGDWSAVTLNTPLVPGDKVATGDQARTELQLDWANILRLDQHAQANLATLEKGRIQVQLSQGLAGYSMLQGSEADAEIDTPNVAVHPLRAGVYRIEINANGDTLVTVRDGEADITTPEGSTRVSKGQLITVRGTGSDVQYQTAAAPGSDDFDKWNADRDHIILSAQSRQQTNPYYTGASDMDPYGVWSEVPDYGPVWVPKVAVGWAPYRDGRWVWEPYYGWTWVSYEPWGWAPYHYGRWFLYGDSWAWWPGPVRGGGLYRPLWAPAYVSFFGFGRGIGVGVGFGGFGSFGWLPVGPCDFVNPWWGRGRDRFDVVAVANFNVRGGIAPLHGGVLYSNMHNVMVNDRMRLGVSTVAAESFGRGTVQARAVSAAEFRQGQVMTGNVPVVPTRDSLRASDRAVSPAAAARPAAQQHFVSRTAPAARPEAFSQQASQVQQAMVRGGATPGQAARNVQAGGGQPAGGFQRFGGPAQTPSNVQQGGQQSTPRFEAQGGPINRVGAPQSQAGTPQSQGQASGAQNGWQRFSNAPRIASPGGNQPSNVGSAQSNSRPPLELNRPIVNQRSTAGSSPSAPRPAPSYSSGPTGGGGRPAPSYSSGPSGGGGGSRSGGGGSSRSSGGSRSRSSSEHGR